MFGTLYNVYTYAREASGNLRGALRRARAGRAERAGGHEPHRQERLRDVPLLREARADAGLTVGRDVLYICNNVLYYRGV